MTEAALNLLDSAVIHSKPRSKDILLEKGFSKWFNSLVYNQIWEDPEVDIAALCLDKDSRVLTISSAGCNVLNYLTSEVQSIHSVDLNPQHTYLTKLKIAAFQNLPTYADYFRFFALGKGVSNIENYYNHVRDNLDEDSKVYWETPVRFNTLSPFNKEARINYFKYGFYQYSKSALFIKFLHTLCRITGCNVENILKARNSDEQQYLYEQHISPAFDHFIVKLLANCSFMFFSLGIPPQQFNKMKSESKGKIIEIFKERVKRLATQHPINKNYFAWQAFGLGYNHIKQEALPLYLQSKYYDKIKQSISKLQITTANLNEYLLKHRAGKFNKFVLLDSQDWMTRDMIVKLWSNIANCAARDSTIIFRTAASSSPIENYLPLYLSRRFSYQKQDSKKLFEQDRSSIYGGFHVYKFIA